MRPWSSEKFAIFVSESKARIAKIKQAGVLPQSNFESYCFYLHMV